MNILERFTDFYIKERTFIFVSFFLTTMIMSLMSLFNTTQSDMKTYVSFLDTTFEIGLNLADGIEVAEEQWTAFHSENTDARSAAGNMAGEFFLFGVTSQLDPVSGLVIEYSLGRNLLPYIVALLIWLVVLGYKFQYWYN